MGCFFRPQVAVVMRWFQPGCGFPDPENDGTLKPFDEVDFQVRLVQPLRTFLSSMGDEVRHIVIVSNSDPRFGLGELVGADGKTATIRAIQRIFSREIENGLITIQADDEWGNNAGSAHALNLGWRLAVAQDRCVDHILSWNPELQMTGSILARMFAHLERHHLDFVGAYRKRYWYLYQWRMAQNTACLWPVEVLEKGGGFSAENCDGNDRATILIPGIGLVTRAGMEDFDFALRLWLASGHPPRWGMVGRADPFLWDVDYTPGTVRARMQQQKVARQPTVLMARAEQHFPDIPYSDLMDAFFANHHQD